MENFIEKLTTNDEDISCVECGLPVTPGTGGSHWEKDEDGNYYKVWAHFRCPKKSD